SRQRWPRRSVQASRWCSMDPSRQRRRDPDRRYGYQGNQAGQLRVENAVAADRRSDAGLSRHMPPKCAVHLRQTTRFLADLATYSGFRRRLYQMSTYVLFFGGYHASASDVKAWWASAKAQKPDVTFDCFAWPSGADSDAGSAV